MANANTTVGPSSETERQRKRKKIIKLAKFKWIFSREWQRFRSRGAHHNSKRHRRTFHSYFVSALIEPNTMIYGRSFLISYSYGGIRLNAIAVSIRFEYFMNWREKLVMKWKFFGFANDSCNDVLLNRSFFVLLLLSSCNCDLHS